MGVEVPGPTVAGDEGDGVGVGPGTYASVVAVTFELVTANKQPAAVNLPVGLHTTPEGRLGILLQSPPIQAFESLLFSSVAYN